MPSVFSFSFSFASYNHQSCRVFIDSNFPSFLRGSGHFLILKKCTQNLRLVNFLNLNKSSLSLQGSTILVVLIYSLPIQSKIISTVLTTYFYSFLTVKLYVISIKNLRKFQRHYTLSFRTRRKALNLCSVQQVNQFAMEKNPGHGDRVLAVGRKIGA